MNQKTYRKRQIKQIKTGWRVVSTGQTYATIEECHTHIDQMLDGGASETSQNAPKGWAFNESMMNWYNGDHKWGQTDKYTIGDPYSDFYTKEELKSWGLVGIYKRDI